MNIISIDYFGTLGTYPSFWQELLAHAKSEDMKIYVISGPWPEDLIKQLESKGYIRGTHYDNVFSILSHLSGKGLEVWYDEDRDSWQSHGIAWYRSKSEICQKIRSRIHFDSDPRFGPDFKTVPTRFVHTGCEARKAEIGKWCRDLKLASTYDDWEDDYMNMMGGFSPM